MGRAAPAPRRSHEPLVGDRLTMGHLGWARGGSVDSGGDAEGLGTNAMVGFLRTPGLKPLPLVFLLLLALLGVGIVLWASPTGIGVGYDSYFYVNGADNILAGLGFGRTLANGGVGPITHFPPLYSTLLALGASVFSVQTDVFARWLGALLFGCNLALFGLLLLRWTDSAAAALLGATLLLVAPPVVGRHLWAMTEPLYLLLLGMTLAALVQGSVSGDRRLLIAGGALAGLTYLSRYVGMALIGAAGVYLISRSRASRKKRFVDFFSFGIPSLAMAVAWLVRNSSISGDLTNRTLLLHPPGLAKLREAGTTLAGWILTGIGPREPRAILMALVGLCVVLVWARGSWRGRELGRSDVRREALDAIGLHAVVYGGSLFVSLTFFDASTRLNDRILLPILVSLLLMGFLIVAPTYKARRSRLLKGAMIVGVVLVFLVPYAWNSYGQVSSARQIGLGFNRRSWVHSETLGALRELPMDTLIYTNEAFPVSFHIGRSVHSVPERLDPVKGQVRADYREQLSTMRSRLEEQGGAMALFHPNRLRVEMPPIEELTEGLVATQSFSDGIIYRPSAEPLNE